MKLDLILVDVEHVAVRDVPGEGSQVELDVKTRAGLLTVRLVGRTGRVIRVTDLRARDKRRSRKAGVLSVPFEAVK